MMMVGFNEELCVTTSQMSTMLTLWLESSVFLKAPAHHSVVQHELTKQQPRDLWCICLLKVDL